MNEDFLFLPAGSLFAYLLVPRKRKRLQAIIAYGALWIGRKASAEDHPLLDKAKCIKKYKLHTKLVHRIILPDKGKGQKDH